MLFDYDDRYEDDILRYAKSLVGHSFNEILKMYNESPQKKYINIYDTDDFVVQEIDDNEPIIPYEPNPNAKGELGNFLEKYYFGYEINSKQEADFVKVGVELKQTCVDKRKNNKFTAGERLSITNISYEEPVQDNFYRSHVWNKIKRILLIHYLRNRDIDRLDYEIISAILFTPPKEDMIIIIQDYKKIIDKIKAGLAHEISEADTLYLGACTKGSTAEKSLVPQYYNNDSKAKKRNFCFKRSYMDYILQHYILKKETDDDAIIDDVELVKNIAFENIVLEKISTYIGHSDYDLCSSFDLLYSNNKALWVNLTYKMLGIKSNKASEFIKADIVVKTIRIDKNNNLKEHMSFPTFKFLSIVQEEWETSDLFNYFSVKKFLFVIFKENKEGHFVLKDTKLWNMPINDLDGIVKNEWLTVKEQIMDIHFTMKKQKNGSIKVFNSLLGEKDSKIIHVRPKAAKSAYKLHCGYEFNINQLELLANPLPNGEWMTKQCFWLNKKYIFEKILKTVNE